MYADQAFFRMRDGFWYSRDIFQDEGRLMILRLVETWIRAGPPNTPQVRTIQNVEKMPLVVNFIRLSYFIWIIFWITSN